MTGDHCFSRDVRPRYAISQRLPPQGGSSLLAHREVRFVTSVHENVTPGLVIIETALQELDMAVRDEGEVTVRPVRVEGGVATHSKEVIEWVAIGECLEQHFL